MKLYTKIAVAVSLALSSTLVYGLTFDTGYTQREGANLQLSITGRSTDTPKQLYGGLHLSSTFAAKAQGLRDENSIRKEHAVVGGLLGGSWAVSEDIFTRHEFVIGLTTEKAFKIFASLQPTVTFISRKEVNGVHDISLDLGAQLFYLELEGKSLIEVSPYFGASISL